MGNQQGQEAAASGAAAAASAVPTEPTGPPLSADEKEDFKKAQQFLAQAQSLQKKKKWEDAAEFYVKASQNFKLSKQWGHCGYSLVQAGDCAMKAKDNLNASDYYKRASLELEKCPERTAEAIHALKQSAEISIGDGKPAMAGHTLRSLAQKEEKEGKLDDALQHWNKAADMFFEAKDKSNSWTCRGEAGRLQLYSNDFKSALITFEMLGQQQSEGDDTAARRVASAKTYWFASLCQLASNSAEAASAAINDYCVQAPAFGEGASGKLLVEVSGHLNEGKLAEYDARLGRYAEFASLSALERRCFALARENAEKNGASSAPGVSDIDALAGGAEAKPTPAKPATIEDELA